MIRDSRTDSTGQPILLLISVLLLAVTGPRGLAGEDSPGSGSPEIRIGTGSGWNYHSLRDAAMSPMLYRGHGYSLSSFLDAKRGNINDRLLVEYQHSAIAPRLDNGSTAGLNNARIEWIHAYKLDMDGRGIAFLAGTHLLTVFNSTNHEQWYNNSFGFNFAVSAGPSILLEFTPAVRKDLQLGWELSLPVLAYVVRPGIASILPERSITRNKADFTGYILGGRLTGIHEYQRIVSSLYLEWDLNEALDLRASYRWDYQQYKPDNRYRIAGQQVGLSLLFKLRKDEKKD